MSEDKEVDSDIDPFDKSPAFGKHRKSSIDSKESENINTFDSKKLK